MKKTVTFLAIALLLGFASCNNTQPGDNKDKIWLHRANTIEKARQFQHDYAGLEIDVHYVDSLKTFLIKHDAEDTCFLRLDDWCRAIENISRLGIWFDFKNLNAGNRDAALQNLISIRKKYHLDGKLYVESHAFKELAPFRSAGFLTSYYIPYFNPYTDDSASCYQHLPQIQDAINSGVDAISGYEFQYKFLKKEFPQQHKLIWTVSEKLDYQTQLINNIGGDSLVDVLLLPAKTIRP